MKEKKKKVAKEVQFEQSNLQKYSSDELVRMVNSTKGNTDFPIVYPDADFSRDLACDYLEKKFGMYYIGHGLVVPHGVTIDDLLDAYEKRNCVGDDAKVMQNGVGNVDRVMVAMNEKKMKGTLSMNKSTMKRWREFTEGYSNKSDYLSAACDLFMEKFSAGTVEMEPDWGMHRE